MLVLVDTNVILRAIESRHEHHDNAVKSMRRLRKDGYEMCLVPQVHYEFWVASTRPIDVNGLGMVPSEALAEIQKLGPPLFRFLRDERAIYDKWYELITKENIQGKSTHDARLVAAMERHGLTHILTFNGDHFKRYPNIIVLDPVEITTP